LQSAIKSRRPEPSQPQSDNNRVLAERLGRADRRRKSLENFFYRLSLMT
jgi:hypothetical protein